MAALNTRYILCIAMRILIKRRRMLRDENKKRKSKRKHWIKPFLLQRKDLGSYQTVFMFSKENDSEQFFRYCRMSPESYDHLLELLKPLISKKNTKFREPISAEIRLAVTLRYLASGESQQSLSWSYRIGRSTVSKIIRETSKAIWDILSPDYLKSPSSEVEWKQVSDDFNGIWNLPNVIGAIDGKHIAVECPKNTGSLYYNYKGFFSIVLLAICDAKYCFTHVDIGQYGSGNDSGVLKHSQMGKCFENNEFNIPPPSEVVGIEEKLPYYLVGDEIFPLRSWLQRPYPGPLDESKKIFNYRLSRARRTIENTFGILAARWRIFLHPIRADIETVILIVQACVSLHNYLQLTSRCSYTPHGFVDEELSDGSIKKGDWRKMLTSQNSAIRNLRRPRGGKATRRWKAFTKCA